MSMADRVPTLVAARILAACRARRRAAGPADLAARLDRRFVVTPTIRLLSDIAVRAVEGARPARHRHRQEPPALARRVQVDHYCQVVARTRHKRALTCRPRQGSNLRPGLQGT
jgi:hypothetical protein